MATLLDLERRGDVAKLDAALAPGQQEWRRIYVRPRVETWMANVLPGLPSALGLEVSPIEQLDAFLEIYCSGDSIMYERQFKPLRHIDSGVWELKMPDLRMFGWFHVRDCFVCTDCDCATRVKSHQLYSGYRDQAVRFRDSLDLDDPKFIVGDDPNAVVSAFCYP
jgi:hypothetical protein